MIYPQATAPLAVANPLFGMGPGVGTRRIQIATSGTIVRVVDSGYGGARIFIAETHAMQIGDLVSITGTVVYDGDWSVDEPTSNSFVIFGPTFAGDSTGNWAKIEV